jgi:L-alanine-DL-glutamate epimerase-like enolase superfamily enzyme
MRIMENYPTTFSNPTMAPVDFRQDGYIYMSDKPGLGIDWNEKTMAGTKTSKEA